MPFATLSKSGLLIENSCRASTLNVELQTMEDRFRSDISKVIVVMKEQYWYQ